MGDDAPRHDSAEQLHQRIDSSKAHPARVYDVFLGGKDNYAADRDAAAAALAANPRGYLDVRHNRDINDVTDDDINVYAAVAFKR